MTDQWDVVVIGGGLAGITAARDLQQRGLRTVVIEANDRLGGRTYTIEDEGCTIELGGTWIHWTQPFIWAEKERYGLEIEETPGCVAEHIVIHRGDRIEALAEHEIAEFMGGFDLFFSEALQVWERPYDAHYNWKAIQERDTISVADRMASLKLTPLQQAAIGGFLEILSMSAPKSAAYVEMMRCFALSGWNTVVFKDVAARYKFAKGTGALVDAIVRDGGFDVITNAQVSTITQGSDGVSIQTSNGDIYQSRIGIVTVPMNVMNTVRFNPPLSPIKREAADVKHAGGGAKVFFVVKGDPGAVMTLARSADSALIGSFTYHRGEHQSLLAGFSLEPDALDKSVEEWQSIFNDYIPDLQILRTFGHPWGTDPLSQGSWCNYRPGTVARFAEALPTREGHLFFASGDHGEGWRGFMEGAIASGSQTAMAVLNSLSGEAAV